jgi:hypothetical protein
MNVSEAGQVLLTGTMSDIPDNPTPVAIERNAAQVPRASCPGTRDYGLATARAH